MEKNICDEFEDVIFSLPQPVVTAVATNEPEVTKKGVREALG